MHRLGNLRGKLLASSRIYDFAMRMFGADRLNRWFIEQLLRPEAGQSVYEAGCGTGVLLAAMPKLSSYFGYDISEEYIEAARRQHPDLEFKAATAEQLLREKSRSCDLFFCLGLLHHLDDSEARTVVRLAQRNLKPGGRFVALEPCRIPGQSFLGRCTTSLDRGKHVRSVNAYLDIVAEGFSKVHVEVVTGLNNLLYTHLAIEAQRPL